MIKKNSICPLLEIPYLSKGCRSKTKISECLKLKAGLCRCWALVENLSESPAIVEYVESIDFSKY